MYTALKDPFPKQVNYDFSWNCNYNKIPIGVNDLNELVAFDFAKQSHLSILGSRGSGKSASAQNILFSCLKAGLKCFVVDPNKKGADFKFANEYLCHNIADTFDTSVALLKYLKNEQIERQKLNAKYGAGKTSAVPKIIEKLAEKEKDANKLEILEKDYEYAQSKTPIILFIDEFISLIKKGTKPPNQPFIDDEEMEKMRQADLKEYSSKLEIASIIGYLARNSRSADIQMVLMTQKMKQKDLDGLGDLKTNLTRIIMGNTSWSDLMPALKNPFNAPVKDMNDIPAGRGLFEPADKAYSYFVQFAYADEDKGEYSNHLNLCKKPIKKVDLSEFIKNDTQNQLNDSGEIIELKEELEL